MLREEFCYKKVFGPNQALSVKIALSHDITVSIFSKRGKLFDPLISTTCKNNCISCRKTEKMKILTKIE